MILQKLPTFGTFAWEKKDYLLHSSIFLHLKPQLCWTEQEGRLISVRIGLKIEIVNSCQKEKQGPVEF